ncbi:MAG: putative holin [Halomonas sp.]|uniref:putative holin n=1 Tax=unclassified Halomonas TaxID=2609666 RepID=UPI003FB65DDE
MAEPATSAAAATMTATGIGLAALLPWINASSLMGAALGAGLVAYSKNDLRAWQRIGALLFSALCGYLMSPEIVAQTPVTHDGTGGFIGALVIVPLSLKLIKYVDKFDLSTWLDRRKGKAGEDDNV